MVAVVAGNGFGIAGSSAARLGGLGQIGSAQMGRGNDQVYVDAANGNLVIDRVDEVLSGVGPDEAYSLTYNSRDPSTLVGTAMAWNLGTYHRLTNITGTVNAAGSTVTRVDRDGSTTLFTYDAAKGYYTSQAGPGATNELRFANGAWTWTDGTSRMRETYGSVIGQYFLTAVTDPDGNTQTYTYTASGTLDRITEANGDYMAVSWNGARPSGVTTSYTNASGLQTLTRIRYTFDSLYRLTSATVDLTPQDNSTADGNSYATTYGYDGNSQRVISIAQTDGSRLDIGYTQTGSAYYVTSLTETVASGVTRVTGFYYDLAHNATSVTDPLGGVTTMQFDSAGNLTGLVRPVPAPGAAAPTTSFEYNANGDVTAVVENGRRTDYAYDAAGNLTGTRDALGNTITRTYDAQNQVLTETRWLTPQASIAAASGASATTRYAYDSENHLRFSVSAEGDVTEYQYDAPGRLTSTIAYAAGKYDVTGLQPTASLTEAALQGWTASTDRSNAERTDTAYDAHGNVHTVTRYSALDSSGTGVGSAGYSQDVYVYDQSGRLLSRVNNASARAETYVYDGLGRIVSATDMANATTTTVFDDANSRTTVTATATGLTDVSVYDKAGELLSVTESGPGIATTVATEAWDALGRLRVETDATQRSTYHVYDAADRKVADVTADGAITEYGYDSSDRLIRKIDYINKLSTSQIASLSGFSAGGSGGSGKGGVSGAVGSSLLVNGSFDQIDAGAAATSTGYSGAALPGWSKNDPTQVQQVASGQMGVAASDGGYWLDLDSIASANLPVGPNLVQNGGFELSASGTAATGTVASSATITGWSATNPQPFQEMASGQGGVAASEGGYWLDLDSSSVARAPTGPNLILNGSFDTSGSGATATSTGYSGATLPYWTSVGSLPFQQIASGQLGVTASNGPYWLDLDSSVQSGWTGTGANLITNGSFETFDPAGATLSGWTKANPEPFQAVASGQGGVAASSGSYWLDLDSTRQTGVVPVGANLLDNGNFDLVAAGATATAGGYSSGTMQGWTSANAMPFQQIAAGQAGITGSSGPYWLDLDSAIQGGWTPGTTNLIANPSFEWLGTDQNIGGWTKTNPEPFQLFYNGQLGMNASDGWTWLDLDSSLQGTPANMDIKEAVTGLAAGQMMSLQFDYANRTTAASGSFDVLWNGTVIASVTDGGTAWQSKTYYVAAIAGSNTIEFRGTGTADDVGASLDNVRLAVAQGSTTPGNMDISQAVSGLTAGETVQLQFDYGDRSPAGSGGFQVLWNGQVIDTVTNGGTAMASKTYVLTAAAGTNTVGFRGVGTADDVGASLDNVRLFRTQPGYTPGNMDISQTVDGLAAGQMMQLQFDYANRTTAASGSFEVWWNGQLIDTISDTGTTMRTKTYFVSAAGVHDVLRFRGTGTADDVGASIDNVRLQQAQPTSVPGNMDIRQTVGFLGAGWLMQLQFDYANRTTTASGSFEVWWNGQLLDTITDTGTTMRTKTYLVTALGGDNEIRFRGTGTADDVGASLDNVSLYQTQMVATPGNMDINQTIGGLAAGQLMQLQFDHANRAGTGSGSFDVLWNGQVVATITDSGTTMKAEAFTVTAVAGNNVLRFRGTGTADDVGASLDNVRLFATQPGTVPGNVDISQTVSALSAGETVQLQFDHANRTSGASGSFQVLWNDQVVATITDTGTAMKAETLSLTALGGTNKLAFRGTGTADDIGASLDNVRLYRTGGTAPGGAAASDPLAGLRPTASDTDDLWTWYGYDAADRLIQTLDSTRRATSFAYDVDSRQVGSTAYARLADASVVAALKANPAAPIVLPAADPADRRTRSFYDNDGQLVGTLDGTGGLSQIFYDAAGQKIREVAYAGRPDSSLWSAGTFAQLLASAGTGGSDRQADYAYDDRGLLRYSIDTGTADNGSVVGFVTERIYDTADRVIRTVSYATAVTPPAAGTAWSTGYIQPRLAADPANDRTARSTYDAAGRLAFSIDAEGGAVAYGYDAAGNVNKVTAFAAAFTTPGDQNLSVMQNWANANPSAANRVTRSLFDAGGRLVYAVDGEGYVSQYRYDAAGRPSSVTRYDAAYSIVDTDTVASVAALIPVGAAGVTTSYAYDSAGRQSDVTAGNVTTHVDYDGHGQITDVWEAYQAADQSRTHRSYDAAGRLLQEVRAYGTAAAQTVTYEYDGVGNLVHETDQRGSVTTRDYDAAGRVVALTAPLSDGVNAVTHYTYDAFGNVVRMDDARNYSTYYYYDRLDRLTLEVDAEGFGTKTAYTAFGQVASVTRYANRANGAPGIGAPPSFTASVAGALRKDATTQFWYDRAGRVRQEQDAEGGSETYHLDAFGERDRVTGKLGDVVAYTYTNRGLVKDETETITAPGTSTSVVTTFSYDARGNRTKMVEAANETEQRTTLYAYDSLDRLKSVTHDQVAVTDSATLATQAWTPVETTDYDNRGNVVRTVDAAGGTSVFYYDAADRKIAAVDPAGTLATWSYDVANGQVTARVYATAVAAAPNPYGPAPTGSGGYRETISDYDRAGRLTKVTVTGAAVGQDANGVYAANASTSFYSSTVYDAAGNVVRQIDARGNSLWYWYDKAGRNVAQVDQENYLTAYDVDAEGNVTRETRYANPVTVAFSEASDPASLTPATSSDDRITDFEYDRNGRRIRETRRNVESYTVDGTGHLSGPNVGDATILYTYNALGEVLTKQEAAEAAGNTINYTYDSAGRLITVSGPAFTDYSNQQVRRTIVNQYDGLGDLTSSTVNGARTTSYSYGVGGRLLSMTDAAQFTRSYGYDKAGRAVSEQWTRTLSDGVTTVTEANVTAYDAAGRVASQGVRTLSGGAWSAGDLTQFRYNAFGDVAAKGMHDLWQETFDYDGAGRLWRSTSGDGTTKYFLADAGGNTTLTVTSSGAAASGTISDVAGLIAYLTNNGANAIGAAPVAGLVATIATYDRRGQTTGTREPLRELGQGQVATLSNGRTYNAFGEVKSETDARSNTTNFAYNTMGRMVLKTDPAVSVTDEHGVVTTGVTPIEHSYFDVSGRLIATRDANGNLTTRALLAGTGYGGTDAMATAEFHADGGVFRTAYDVFGDARTLTNELQHAETRTYDAMDRLVSIAHAARDNGVQLVDSYGYDGLGRRLAHWNSQLGTTAKETTDYDSQGRVVRQVETGGDTTTYAYGWDGGVQTKAADGSVLATFGGWQKTTVNAAGKTATETDDYFGRVTARSDFGGHGYSLFYDKAGRLASQTNTVGQNLAYSYYNTGQLAQIVSGTDNGYSGDTATSQFAYDLAGNRTFESHAVTGHYYDYYDQIAVAYTTSLENATATWDALNRMTSYTDSGSGGGAPVTIAYEYDLVGNVRHVGATYYALTDQGANASAQSTQDYWYRYDAMNRFVTTKGILSGVNAQGQTVTGNAARGVGTISHGDKGVDVTYDLAGERKTATSQANLTGKKRVYNSNIQEWEFIDVDYVGERRDTYNYTADGYLDTVQEEKTGWSIQNQQPTGGFVGGQTIASYGRDAMGRVTTYIEYSAKDGTFAYERDATYNVKSQITDDTVTTMYADDVRRYVTVSHYDYQAETYAGSNSFTGAYLGGAVTHVSAAKTIYDQYGGQTSGGSSDTRNDYQWWDAAQQSVTTLKPDATYTNTSTYYYDDSGHLTSVYIQDQQSHRNRTVTFVNDAAGLVLERKEQDNIYTTGDPRELHYYFNEAQVGFIGNNGTSDLSYADSIAEHQTETGSGPFRNGTANAIPVADFDQSYQPVNGLNQGPSAGLYYVRDGDTLQSIAEVAWGDASLWYLIADANGLSGAETLRAGQTLSIPNKVTNVHNNATTFRPYDPNDVLGDLSPSAPKPVSNSHHGGCGVIGTLLLVAIAVAVTVVSSGAFAAVAASSATGGSFGLGAGLSLLAGNTVAGVSMTGFGLVAAGAVGAAAGSIVSQGVGVATGLQSSFSWKDVALAAVAGGVSAGLGQIHGGLGRFLSAKDLFSGAARGIISNVATQGIALATGLQSHFDWKAVAVGAAVGGVSAQTRGYLPASTDRYVAQTLAGGAGAIAGAAARSLIDGSDFGDNIMAALPDVLGSTVGSFIGDRISAAALAGLAPPPRPEASAPAGGGFIHKRDNGQLELDADLGGSGFHYAAFQTQDRPPSDQESSSVGDIVVWGVRSRLSTLFGKVENFFSNVVDDLTNNWVVNAIVGHGATPTPVDTDWRSWRNSNNPVAVRIYRSWAALDAASPGRMDRLFAQGRAERAALAARTDHDLRQFNRQVLLVGAAGPVAGATGAAGTIVAGTSVVATTVTSALSSGNSGYLLRSAMGGQNSFRTYTIDAAFGAGGNLAVRGAGLAYGRFTAASPAPLSRDPLAGPVVFNAPADATPAEIAQLRAYVSGANDALEAGALSPSGRVSTRGALRTDASLAAAQERARAAAAGAAYEGHVGHVPDTTWTGDPVPYSWLDISPRLNSSLGGQAGRYPLGYKPTKFYVGPH